MYDPAYLYVRFTTLQSLKAFSIGGFRKNGFNEIYLVAIFFIKAACGFLL